jgi:hypothetical protein
VRLGPENSRFLGHVVSEEGMTDPKKIESVKDGRAHEQDGDLVV